MAAGRNKELIRGGGGNSAAVRSRRPAITHYADYDATATKYYLRAKCGRLIKRRDHTNEPTCDQCRRLLTEAEGFRF